MWLVHVVFGKSFTVSWTRSVVMTVVRSMVSWTSPSAKVWMKTMVVMASATRTSRVMMTSGREEGVIFKITR